MKLPTSGLGLIDAADPHRRRARLGERDVHDRPDVEVVRARGVGVDQQLAGGQRRSAAVRR